jgi:transcriptional regulator with XRE-family HTH domain
LATEQAQRLAFGAFLRSRRERLTPGEVGLPDGFRRRTPGLRREEVALLAGVGTTWYTWLEQGREVNPSPQVLGALARALRLDATEQSHLFVLANKAVPESRACGPEEIDEPLRRMLASLTRQPAHVLGRRWDILAWNRAAEVLFGDYGELQGDERNILHLVFANPQHRKLLVDWAVLAPAVLAMFRADSARYAGDPDFARLIATLLKTSREFRQLWTKHEIQRPLAGSKRIDHPVAGRMLFEYSSFAVTDRPDMKLIVYTPLTEENTAEKLDDLLGAVAAAERHETVEAARRRRA